MTRSLTTAERPDLLGGITVIEAPGQRIPDGSVRRAEPATPEVHSLLCLEPPRRRPHGRLAAAHGSASARVPYDTSKWVGANYTPAYAANQVQMWHEFKPDVIERELAAAQKAARHHQPPRLSAQPRL